MVTQFRSLVFAVAAAFLVPTMGWAHPGHGSDDSGLVHYVTEPVHTISMVGLLLLSIVVATMLLATRMRRQVGNS